MKITDVKVWLVQGIKYNWTLLKIYTDEGYTGVGEATNWPGSPIVFEAAKHVGQRIIGLDPMKTDFIWTKLYRDLNWIGPYGASLCAISGIDMALLDLIILQYGLNVVSDSVLHYGWYSKRMEEAVRHVQVCLGGKNARDFR